MVSFLHSIRYNYIKIRKDLTKKYNMNKRKFVFGSLLMAAFLSFTATSCGDDDDDDDNQQKITNDDKGGSENTANDSTINGYGFVDLGLPSGTLWAICNVGAQKETESGDFFAWGETEGKTEFNYKNYKYITDNSLFSKYVANKNEGIVDSYRTLIFSDDAATVNWGTEWRMPSPTEQQELLDGCNWEWSDDYNGSGVAGSVGISKTNGRKIFMPAAGYIGYNTEHSWEGQRGYYWSSKLGDTYSCDSYALILYADADSSNVETVGRIIGRTVRPVADVD